MTPRDNGKAWEREVARDFDTNRTGPTGKNDCDINYAPVGIECKYQGRLSLRTDDLTQARRNAGDRPWALVLKERGGRVKLMVLDYDHGVELLRKVYG